VAGAVARRSKVADALPPHHRRWAGRAKPRVRTQTEGFYPRRISTAFIGRLSCRLGTLGLLRRRGLALHLLLCILRRRCSVSSGAIHRAGRRVLINPRIGTSRLPGTTHCRSGACVLQTCGPAVGVARAGLCGAGTKSHNGEARENKSFRVHLLLPGFPPGLRPWHTRRTRNGAMRRRFLRAKVNLAKNSIDCFLVRVASDSGAYEAIHETFVHTITRSLAHDLSYLTCVCPRQAARSAGVERRNLAPEFADVADREGAARQEVVGRATNRQLQCADRQAGDQAAAQRLLPRSDGLVMGRIDSTLLR
jgi:hypothetical protein